MNRSQTAKVVRFSVAAACAAVVGIAGLYAWLVSQPTGFEEAAEARRRTWKASPPPDTTPRRGTSETPAAATPGAAPTPRPPPLRELARLLVTSPFLSHIDGPLGHRVEWFAVASVEFTIPASEATRSPEPARWEALPADRVLVAGATMVSAPPTESAFPNASHYPTEGYLMALEAALDPPWVPDDFEEASGQPFDRESQAATGLRWLVLKAMGGKDRDLLRRRLDRWFDFELSLHRTGAGKSEFLREARAFLALAAASPDFPTEMLESMQERAEAAFLTPEEEAELEDRRLLRARLRTRRSAENPNHRVDNPWHRFAGGGFEETTVDLLMPGIRRQIDAYTKARLDRDEGAADTAGKTLNSLWYLANLNGSGERFFLTDADWPRRVSWPTEHLGGLRVLRRGQALETIVVLLAMHRFRADHGRMPTGGTDLVPEYLTEEFLRSTGSAWRFADSPHGPLLMRFEPDWTLQALPDGSRMVWRPGGAASATAEEIDLLARDPQLFRGEVLVGRWEYLPIPLQREAGVPGGS